MFDKFERDEKLAVVGGAVILLAVGFSIGSFTNNGGMSTGSVAASTDAGSTDQIRQTVQQLMDRRIQQQQARLRQAVNQSENLTMGDVGISAEVTSVTESQFPSLYKVNASISGTVPSRLGGGTRDVSQVQTLYISQDGRYLFQQPTDLQQPRQPRRPSP